MQSIWTEAICNRLKCIDKQNILIRIYQNFKNHGLINRVIVETGWIYCISAFVYVNKLVLY